MISFIVSILIVFLILSYLHLTRNFNYWKNKKVPFIKPTFLFGNAYPLVTLQKSIIIFLSDIYNKSKTSPYYGFYVFDQPFLLIQDPQLIKKVLVNDFDYFCNRSVVLNKRDKYSANTLFMAVNPKWKLIRTKVASAFSSSKLKNMVPLIVNAGRALKDNIEKKALRKESINCRDCCIEYAINVISAVAFGLDAKAHEHSKFFVAAKEILGTSLSRRIQLASYFFAPVLVKIFNMKFANQNCAKFLEGVFLKSVNDRKSTKFQRGDFIDLLVKLSEDEKLFDDDILVSLALQYLNAGFETTGASLAFVLYELALNISVQDRLRDEILSIVNTYEDITSANIQKLQYLNMVILESLRKYPTLAFLDRRCTKNYKIPNSDLTIEKGIPVYISTWSLHYDENYFSDPQKFDPERFSPENISNINPYTYMPFGDGYRNCLGYKFGLLAISVGIIQILKNFKVEKSATTPENLDFASNGFLLVPEGNTIDLKLTPIST